MTNPYRTHTCDALRSEDADKAVKLAGWVCRKRNHGSLLFLDLRDHYGTTQCIVHADAPCFVLAETLKSEDIVIIEGRVVQRDASVVNAKMPTGEIEVAAQTITLLKASPELPLPVHSDAPYDEAVRLQYRYLDLRREKMHRNIVMRSKIIQSLRQRMLDQGFLELQTPILTASSPEGARDYLVPSRHFPGKFYALPQAPQQFKQLYMVAGFDKYFQIAPCFRDEDARADRSPGEFYQLDFEMAFATQEDVFAALEPVLHGVFKEFTQDKKITDFPFPRITYEDAIRRYGTDKPDLRNPLEIVDVTSVFKGSNFSLFADLVAKGATVRGIAVPSLSSKSRKFFDDLNAWARMHGVAGLSHVMFEGTQVLGPISKYLSEDRLELLHSLACRPRESEDEPWMPTYAGKTIPYAHGEEWGMFLMCGSSQSFAGLARDRIARALDIVEKDAYRFCWVVDFPMFEKSLQTGKIDFSHNPFSMPQGGLEALNTQDPFKIKAYQYDIVCNGVELSSGAIRNHDPEIMRKVFEIAGYSQKDLETRFPALLTALQYGAPPHGGSAPGIDRIVMLILEERNLREVVAFPLTQQAQDLMMNAPCEVSEKSLKELGIKVLP